VTAALANRVVLEALSAIARRRRDAAEGTSWDPALPLLADRDQASAASSDSGSPPRSVRRVPQA
jgi:agmatinase